MGVEKQLRCLGWRDSKKETKFEERKRSKKKGMVTKMKTRLSVIIPVFNTAPFLNKCINSVLSQSFEDFELICVDNYSTDGSSDILRECAKKDSRVKYHIPERHGRATETRQFGLQLASGEFITFVDSDDSVKPGMYKHMFSQQENHCADIVVCNFDMVYPDRVKPEYSDMRDEVIDLKATGYQHYFNEYFCMTRPNNYLWSRIIRRSIAVENEIEFQPVDISEDTIFSMLCTAFAKRVVHISNSYYNYFQRDDSAMRVTIRSRNIADSYVYAFDCVERYVNTHGLRKMFTDILPVYAATRVRSIMFYMNLVGRDDSIMRNSLEFALRGSSITAYLRRAVSENLIDNKELIDTVRNMFKLLEMTV